MPVIVESWGAFAALFEWRARPVTAGARTTCASYLGAAVRRFFAQGGRRAIVVRTGDPWPYLEAPGTRAADREARLGALLPNAGAAPPFDPTDPGTWRGIQHVYGLPEVSLLCLPDLADACADDPAPADSTLPLVPVAEAFVECSSGEAPPAPDVSLRRQQAPRCRPDGLAAWAGAVGAARDFLARRLR